MTITLRPYQEKARYWVNQKLNDGRHPLLVMPTGTGKSPTSAQIARDRVSLGKKLLVLVPQYELFNQMLADYSNMNPGYINDTGVNGRHRDVYICMVKSLDNILVSLPEKFCRQFSEIIIDEAHFSAAPTWVNIFEHFHWCLRFGMTATPYRYDNKPLGEYYTDMYEPITMTESIKAGYLCKPVIIVPEEYENVIPDNAEYDINDQRQHIHQKKIIGDVLKTYKEVFNGAPVIIPCTTHKHAEETFDSFYEAGWVTDHIHSKMNKFERRRIVNDVKNGETNILITVGVGVFGLNIVGLAGIIWLRLTESLTIFMQFNGRPMRPAQGKDKFIYIDPVGNSVLHGRPDINRKWSLHTDYEPGQDISDAPESQKCPVCKVMNNIDNNNCWICGYDFITGLLDGDEIDKKSRKLPKIIDGELVYLDGPENEIYHIDDKKILVNKNDTAEEIEKKLTKAGKIKILSRDLTGIRVRTKFKEGIKWLQ